MSQARIDAIRAALEAAFAPESLEVGDDSHLHVGHAGARSGKGHFSVRIVSGHFTGMSLVARHRAIYTALGALMIDDIHALAIDARSPQDPPPPSSR